MFAWVAISAGVAILCPEYILAAAIQFNPDYIPKDWHYFLIYQISNIVCVLYNIFAIRTTSVMYNIGCKFSCGIAQKARV